jgi:hypothetical protein
VPELAAAYFAGMIACLCLTAVYSFLRVRRRCQPALQLMQRNLRKAGYYWSENSESLVLHDEGTPRAQESEIKKSDRNAILIGVLFSLLSWGGTLFLMVVMVSERFLAQSRKERKLLNSDLAKTDLTAADVKSKLGQLEILG